MVQDLGKVYDARLICISGSEWGSPDLMHQLISVESGYDCFLVNIGGPFEEPNSAILERIALRAGGWIEVLGESAEDIHDAVDAASARIGRQAEIGEGNPMTSWHDELDFDEISSYIRTGGQGEGDTKLIVIVGPSLSVEKLIQVLSPQS